MGIYVNPNNSAFQRSLNSAIYVDKSPLIAELNRLLNTSQCYLCVCRPRRFGKSYAADMISAYYSKGCDSASQFSTLKIAQDRSYAEHLNRHNVIYLNMQTFWTRAQGDVVRFIADVNYRIKAELQKTFPQIDLSSENELYDVLNLIFDDTGEQFIFVIDEWDCVLRNNLHDAQSFSKFLAYLNALLKDQSYVALAYMTGILPIKKYCTQSVLNMFDEITMIEPMNWAQYIGFTENEVTHLCNDHHSDYLTIKLWYDGYSSEKEEHIYNPNSVVKAITNASISSYWTQTETYEGLKRYIDINFDGLKNDIFSMLAGDEIEFNPGKFQNDMVEFYDKNDVLTLLVHLGYLAVRIQREANATKRYFARIPNQEIRGEFINSIENNANYAGTWKAIAASQKLLEAVWDQDAKTVAQGIETAHEENSSILRYNDENSLACVVSNALYHARNYYQVVREAPAGKGFADLVYMPLPNVDKPPVIIELKQNASAAAALAQIKERNYTGFFKDQHSRVLLVGINYDAHSKKHECIIESWDPKA